MGLFIYFYIRFHSVSADQHVRVLYLFWVFFFIFFISLLLKIHLKEKKIKILIILSIMQVNILSSALTWISLFLKKKDLKQKLQERCVEKDPTGFLSNQGGGFKMWTD